MNKKRIILIVISAFILIWMGPSRITKMESSSVVTSSKNSNYFSVWVHADERTRSFWNFHDIDIASHYGISMTEWGLSSSDEIISYEVYSVNVINKANNNEVDLIKTEKAKTYFHGGGENSTVYLISEELSLPFGEYEFALRGEYCTHSKCFAHEVDGNFSFSKHTSYMLYIPWVALGI